MKLLLKVLVLSLVALACAPVTPPETPEATGEPAAQDARPEPPAVQATGAAPSGSALMATIRQRGKLLVGTSGEQPPFTMKDRGGNLFGLEIDLARSLAQSLGVGIEFVELPFGDLLKAVEAHQVDMALSSITMTPKRNLNVAFIGPYFVSGKALLTKDQTLSKIKHAGNLDRAQVRLGALKGSTSEELVGRVAPHAKLSSFETFEKGVEAVARNEIDALMGDMPAVAVAVLRNPDAGFAGLGDKLSFEPIGVAMPADDAHFQNLVGNYLKLAEGAGYLEALRTRWLGQADWLQSLPPGYESQPLDPGGSGLSL